jgi:formate dehydrogenase subunit gamma
MMRIAPRGRLFPILGMLILLFLALPVTAQPSGQVNPTAAAQQERQLLQEMQKLEGRITLPQRQAAVLEQPQGRQYQDVHERLLPWSGAIIILSLIAVLAAFYLVKGRLGRDVKDSGRKIERFNFLERANHWMTATCFIVLALTGLNYIFGKRLIMSLVGPDGFATWSQWAKYAHNFFSWPFMVGILVMILLWLRDNLPNRYDWEWLKSGGGIFGRGNPDAARFNAGQKLFFWAVVLGGIWLSATGLLLLFPFVWVDINGMQVAQYMHAGMGILLIAVILSHIYIGTIGMKGAYDAMGDGKVDLAWAQHHHRIWVDERRSRQTDSEQPARPASQAGE